MTMTFDASNDAALQHPTTSREMPVAVQVLSTLLFAAFAIPVTLVALNVFWPAGVALAIILAWRGGFAPTGPAAPPARDVAEAVQSLMPTTAPRSSGNASFDAYRDELISRLEQEQENFEGFLARLRAAKDEAEFDSFMDDRARRVTETFDGPTTTDAR